MDFSQILVQGDRVCMHQPLLKREGRHIPDIVPSLMYHLQLPAQCSLELEKAPVTTQP